tara:strand:+ start:1129 stop:1491 length:363 start_codon:yes stop_codon:yes gene_type:complete
MENFEGDNAKFITDEICLNFFQEQFEKDISNYALVNTENLKDEDNDAILKVYYFERGIDNHILVLYPDGGIKTVDEGMPIELLADIHNCIIDTLERNELSLINKLGKVVLGKVIDEYEEN